MPSYFVTWLDKSFGQGTAKTVRLNLGESMSPINFDAVQAALVKYLGEAVIGGRPKILHVMADTESWHVYESLVPATAGMYVLCLVGDVPYFGKITRAFGDPEEGEVREIVIKRGRFEGRRVFPESTIIRMMDFTPRTDMAVSQVRAHRIQL